MKKSFSKKSLALLLTVAVVLTSLVTAFAVTASATVNPTNVWGGQSDVADSYALGSGTGDTANDPILISNGAELAKLAKDNTQDYKYYKLTSDIYLNDVSKANWKENANSWYSFSERGSARFYGNLDGDGHTIYGLYYNGSEAYFGLFCRGDASFGVVTISNLRIANSDIKTTGDYAGAFMGFEYNHGFGFEYNKCIIEDTVSISSKKYAGGLVCYSQQKTKIYACGFYGNLEATYKGGLVGYYSKGSTSLEIDQCFAVGNSLIGQGSADTLGVYYSMVSANEIIGEAAKTRMPNLAWDEVWYTTENGYPTLTAPEAPACDHTNKETTDNVTKAATYFTTGLKDVVCECGETVEEDVVIPYDTATPVKFDKPVLNPETNELTVAWEYSAALSADLVAAGDNKALTVKFAFGDKEYTVPNTVLNTEGGSVTIEGINADRFNKTFSLNLEFTVDTYDTTTLNSVAVLNDVVLGDVIDNTSDKSDEYTALIGAINTADSAVVEGAGTGSADFTAGASSVDIKAGTATFKFVATDKFVGEVTEKGTANRTVKLVVTVGGENHEVTINALKTHITVTIKGLSFEQMYGSVSAKLVITYTGSEVIDSQAVTFNFEDNINNSNNAVAEALEALLKN